MAPREHPTIPRSLCFLVLYAALRALRVRLFASVLCSFSCFPLCSIRFFSDKNGPAAGCANRIQTPPGRISAQNQSRSTLLRGQTARQDRRTEGSEDRGQRTEMKKQEKRTKKHGALMAKIQKSQPQKRQRQRPKNLANLQALADALPDFDPDLQGPESSVNVIRQKTLRHKPGAQKRRQKLEKVERDRFASNMAQMAAMPKAEDRTQMQTQSPAQTQSQTQPDSESQESAGTANRWAALRSFISQTMEHQPVFK